MRRNKETGQMINTVEWNLPRAWTKYSFFPRSLRGWNPQPFCLPFFLQGLKLDFAPLPKAGKSWPQQGLRFDSTKAWMLQKMQRGKTYITNITQTHFHGSFSVLWRSQKNHKEHEMNTNISRRKKNNYCTISLYFFLFPILYFTSF